MGKQFTAQTFRWLHQLNSDKRLLAIDLCVCVELTKYFNERDQRGRAWPGAKTLGDAIGLHEVTVLRSVRRVEAAGHLRIIWGQRGSGHSNHYWMIVKPAAEQVSKPAARSSKKPAGQSEKPAATQVNLLKTAPRGSLKAPPLGEGEREELAPSSPAYPPREPVRRAFEGAPARGQEAGEDAAPPSPPEQASLPLEEEKQQQTSQPEDKAEPPHVTAAPEQAENPNGRRREESPAEPSETLTASEEHIDATWRELRALWQRGHMVDDLPKAIAITRQSFVKAIRDGTDPDGIVEAARCWIAAADAPRFLPRLGDWLAARGYEKPPPEKPKRAARSTAQRAGKPPRMTAARAMADLVDELRGG